MLEQLLDNLNSRDPNLREDAERRLRALSPDDLIQFAQLEQTQFQRWADKEMVKFGVRIICWASVVTAVVLVFALLLRLFKTHLPFLITPITMGTVGWMVGRYRFKPPYSRDIVVSAIRKAEDVRLVPTLLAMENELKNERATNKAINEALLELLPQLCAAQAADWTLGEQQKFLWHLDFTICRFERNMATLKALEQIGGEWAIPAVAKCARMDTRSNALSKPFNMTHEAAAEKARLLKQAAQECLPFLEQRQQEARQAQTLLRASAAVTPPDTLLRPAASTSQEPSGEQLLRPASDK